MPARVLVGRRHGELLHLLELVHAEDAERVAAVRAHLLAETRRVADVALGQVLGLEPLLPVQRAQRLLRRGDHVLVLALARQLHRWRAITTQRSVLCSAVQCSAKLYILCQAVSRQEAQRKHGGGARTW